MLNPGTYLQDRYEILEKIGSGGMSVVYKVTTSRDKSFMDEKKESSDKSSETKVIVSPEGKHYIKMGSVVVTPEGKHIIVP